MKKLVLEELERLRLRYGGLLTPQQIVRSATPKSSPLHNQFNWDNSEAAYLWRLEQARHLIRVFVKVVDDGKRKRETRMYVALSSDRKQGGGYRYIAEVLSDKEMRATLLDDARSEMIRFRMKYASLIELTEVFNAMEKFLGKGKKRRRK